MRIGIILLLLIAVTTNGISQRFVAATDIPVREDGGELRFAWTGGLTAPQLSLMDLNMDGTEDLVVFDRYSAKILTFVAEGSDYSYAPEYGKVFPENIDDWLLLRDFNGDGKKDIFTSTALGMDVYVNTSENGEISWRLFNSRAPGPSPLLTQGFNSAINLQLNATDIPSISDLDGDGDLDILVFRFAGGSSVEFHRNYSMENDGSLDSLQMARVTSAWGGFRECFCGTFAFDYEECTVTSGRPLHEGGKTLAVLDLDGDQLPEALVSEELCSELFYLKNEGTASEAWMTGVIDYLPGQTYPFFPAAYIEDFSNDGRDDLVFATNWPSPVENYKEVIPLLVNTGTSQLPEFSQITDRFLLEDMIDLGGMSHPAFTDLDGDGRLDAVVGNFTTAEGENPQGRLTIYRNIGTSGNPAFEKSEGQPANLEGFYSIRPYFLDVNADGQSDLVFSAMSGTVHNVYFILNSGNSGNPFPGSPTLLYPELGSQDVVSFGLVDADNIPDMFIGRNTGRVDYFIGVRTNGQLGFELSEQGAFGMENNNARGAAFVVVTDVDGDGQNDLFRTDREGGAAWLNDYSESSNEWAAAEFLISDTSATAFKPGRNLAPVFVNLLNRSKPQLVLGSAAGGLQFFIPEDSDPLPGPGRIQLYPNPVSQGTFFLDVNEQVDVRIIDASGRVISDHLSIAPGEPVDVTKLASGTYYLHINTPGHFQRISFVVLR